MFMTRLQLSFLKDHGFRKKCRTHDRFDWCPPGGLYHLSSSIILSATASAGCFSMLKQRDNRAEPLPVDSDRQHDHALTWQLYGTGSCRAEWRISRVRVALCRL